MRVLIVSQYYPPEAFEQIADFVERLQKAGHEVVILTSFPCYPKGKIFDGFRQRLGYRQIEGDVLVHRVIQFPDHTQSALRRILYYASFCFSSVFRVLLHRPKCDVVLAYQFPITVGIAARLIGWILGKRVAFFVLDLWPESVIATGMLRSRFALGVLGKICSWVYRSADANICITEGYIERLRKMGVRSECLHMVHYWASVNDAASQVLEPLGSGSHPFRVLYAGNMGPAQGLGVMIDVAKRLREKSVAVEVVFVGDGLDLECMRRRVETEGVSNVIFLGRKPMGEIPALQDQADALLVHLKPDVLSRVSIPSKTVAYLRSGKPLLMCVEGECTRLVERSGCGVTAEPSNASSISSAIERLIAAGPEGCAAMGTNARRLWEAEFNPPVLAERMISILKNNCRGSDCRANTQAA